MFANKMLFLTINCLRMNISVIFGNDSYAGEASYRSLDKSLRLSGHVLTAVPAEGPLPRDTDMLISVGGDGTFLGSARLAAPAGVPVVGVNLGHLGFLSENSASAVAEAIAAGRYGIQERAMLTAVVGGREFHALNDVCVRRSDGSMLGIRVTVDGCDLPVYWADGLLVSTPSGSTAYSLSVGGPIVMPSSKVLIIAPIAPHNLNVRPMIVPQESRISLKFLSRSDTVIFSADNYSQNVGNDSAIEVGMAQFSLKRVCLGNSNFVKALSDKLFWGEDKRNGNN